MSVQVDEMRQIRRARYNQLVDADRRVQLRIDAYRLCADRRVALGVIARHAALCGRRVSYCGMYL